MSSLLGACYAHGAGAGAAPLYAEAAAEDPRGKPYVIGVADVVRISVWNHENLSAEAIVRPDGTLTMPLVGELSAAGHTAQQLQQDAAKRLETVVKDTVVTVSVIEINSYRFTVSGNVERPGLFNSRSYVTVADAIALAGGPNRYASTDAIVVVRAANGHPRRIPVDYDEILAGRRPEQNFVLLAGDAVQVP